MGARSHFLPLAIAVAVAICTNPVFGQDAELVSASDAEKLGNWQIGLKTEFTVNDNFYHRRDNKASVAGGTVAPSVEYNRSTPGLNWTTRASSKASAYSFGSADNFFDYEAGTSLTYKLSARQRVGLFANYQHRHDPYGTDRTDGSDAEVRKLDEWNRPQLGAVYQFDPSRQARLGWILRGTWTARDYVTNEAETDFLDRSSTTGDLTVLLMITPKVFALGQYLYSETTYDHVETGTPDRSGSFEAVLGGIRWVATAKTSGDFRAGRATRRFDQTGSDFDAPYWRAGWNWTPTARTHFRLSTGREFRESYRRAASFIDSRWYELYWNQDWNLRTYTTLSTRFSTNEFRGTAEVHDLVSVSGRVTYRLSGAARLFARYQYRTREATPETLDFDQATLAIGVDVDLN